MQAIVDLIVDKSRKLQYDEAEIWAEELFVSSSGDEQSKLVLGYILMLQAKCGAAERILSGSNGKTALYLLSKCKYLVGKYKEAVDLSCDLEKYWDKPSSQEVSIGISVSLADVKKLLGQSYRALGFDSKSKSSFSAAFALDETLVHCSQNEAVVESSTQEADENETWQASRETGKRVTTPARTKRAKYLSSKMSSPTIYSVQKNLLEEMYSGILVREGNFKRALNSGKALTFYSLAVRAYCLHEIRQYNEVIT
jgi:hypothetical protein